MLKAFKTEISPDKIQAQKIRQSIGNCRWLYNQYIAHNLQLYRMYQRGFLDKNQKHFLSGYDFDKYVNNKLKKIFEFIWIDLCGAKARKQAIMNAEKAFKNFFAGKTGFPKFKKKKNEDVKIYFPKNNSGDWTIWRHKIKIPTIGIVKLKEFGYLPTHAKIKSGTVSYKAGKYFVSVVAELPDDSRKCKDNLLKLQNFSEEGLGIDLGIKSLATLSNEKNFPNINKSRIVRRIKKKLRREQRSLSRKFEMRKKCGALKTDSRCNINKNTRRVQKLYRRLTNIRVNYENQIIHEILKQKPSFISLEDLNVRGMMRNKHLAGKIQEQRFYFFRNKLTTKAKFLGIEVRIVDRFYGSSKICHECGFNKKDLKLKDRIYECPQCGTTLDRDLNAALNLRNTNKFKIA